MFEEIEVVKTYVVKLEGSGYVEVEGINEEDARLRVSVIYPQRAVSEPLQCSEPHKPYGFDYIEA